jgi:hypothetical protein
MRRIALFLLLGGCASAGTPSEDVTPKQPVIYAGDQSTATLLGERPRATSMALAVGPAAVWMAAKQVYASIEVPVAIENPTAHQLGNSNFFKARSMAGQPMTQFVDCGSGMTGPKAASYRIYMSLITQISSDGNGGSVVQTTFVPMGQDVTQGSTDRIPCGSTGRLEQLVLDRIKAGAVAR